MQSRNFCASTKQVLRAALVLLALAESLMWSTQSAEAATRNYRLPATAMTHMAYAPSTGSRNGLPATTMDSFVKNAIQAHRAELIYGDEGTGDNPPPFYDGFTAAHRINAGIVGQQDAGLTTGHGSHLPDAWGRDEYLGGQEWSQSGVNNGAYDKIVSPDVPVVASYDVPPLAPSFGNRRFVNNNSAGAGVTSGASESSSAYPATSFQRYANNGAAQNVSAADSGF